jgi:hypothetical protein
MNKFFASALTLAALPACCFGQSSQGVLGTLTHDLSIEYVRQSGAGFWMGNGGMLREGATFRLGAALPARLAPPPMSLARRIDDFEQGARFVTPHNSFLSKSYSVGLHRGEGVWSLTSRRMNLGPGVSQHDVELTYTQPVDRNSRLAGALMLRSYPWHEAQGSRDLLLGVRYTRRF